jgi:hypothetical protein
MSVHVEQGFGAVVSRRIEGGTRDEEALAGIVEYLIDRVGAKLIAEDGLVWVIGLRIQYVDGVSAAQRVRLQKPAACAGELRDEATELFRKLAVRKSNVQAVSLSAMQADPGATPRRKQVPEIAAARENFLAQLADRTREFFGWREAAQPAGLRAAAAR